MQEPGHIYVLVNPSIEGLVKIGKTARDPELRANELSQATGVATPFYVAFSIQVADCHSAEEYVYAILEHNGFKRSPNREFFQMPLRTAIEVLLAAEKELAASDPGGQEPSEEVSYESSVEEPASQEHPAAALFERAMDLYSGYGDEIQDKRAAVKILDQAKALNFPAAFTSLSEHYIDEANGESDPDRKKDLFNEAFDVLREGADRGHGRCYIKMAMMYLRGYGNTEPGSEVTNAQKCWRKYLRSTTFLKNDDSKFADEDGYQPCGLDYRFDSGCSRVDHAVNYFTWIAEDDTPIDLEIRRMLLPLREQILSALTKRLNAFEERPCSDVAAHLENLSRTRKLIAFVEKVL
jgi:hypothetical protein